VTLSAGLQASISPSAVMMSAHEAEELVVASGAEELPQKPGF
jgi:hypothetical protein